MRNEWTPMDIDILRREYPVKTAKEIADKLRRGERAVYIMAYRLGLQKDHYGTVWTPHMLTMIRALFATSFNKSLAMCLGVSERTLIRKARELGLEKHPDFLTDRRDDIANLAREGLKKAYREGRLTSTFKKGVHNNPAGEFRKGHVESPETKARRSAAMKAAWKRRKQEAKFRKDYNINNN